MAFQVFLTDNAAQDLEDLYDYIKCHDVPGKAEYVLNQIEEVFTSLTENPHRGVYPKELTALGIHEFREIFFKPYRIIYRVNKEHIYILLIIDGRRDMEFFLQRRLLQG